VLNPNEDKEVISSSLHEINELLERKPPNGNTNITIVNTSGDGSHVFVGDNAGRNAELKIDIDKSNCRSSNSKVEFQETAVTKGVIKNFRLSIILFILLPLRI